MIRNVELVKDMEHDSLIMTIHFSTALNYSIEKSELGL